MVVYDGAYDDFAGAGNGFEALRQIYADYRPQGGASEHSLLTTIVQPRWWTSDDHAKRSFVEVLHDWDHLITQYELASQEKVSERLKCATILGYAPTSIKKMLEGASQDVREQYSVMRTRIREHCLEKNVKAFVPKAPEPSGATSRVTSIFLPLISIFFLVRSSMKPFAIRQTAENIIGVLTTNRFPIVSG